MLVRLNKYIAQSGTSSRRAADRLISDGKVRVNGRIVRTLGQKINSDKDVVEVEGRTIQLPEDKVYLMLHKPSGCLVTRKDPYHRPTVMDLVPPLASGIFPVGRLDLDSEGLLLLTNDGELAHRLLHPRYGVKKLYRIKVKDRPAPAILDTLRQGIYLDGKKTAPARITPVSLGDRHSWLDVEIHEGRKREVRRLFESQGYPVLSLKRLQFAGLSLERLAPGAWRVLSPAEIRALKKQAGL
ncbi:MAG: pseudouridine synthase [Candidatus Aminicenantaceae bacterium]